MNLYLKSVKNLQEIVTSVSYISLNLFCYITSLQDADRVLIPIHKVRALRILGFYTPYPSSLPRYSFDDPFPNNVRTLSAFPQYQKKTLTKLFRFVSYLRKSLSLTFLFSDGHVRGDNPGEKSVKHNV